MTKSKPLYDVEVTPSRYSGGVVFTVIDREAHTRNIYWKVGLRAYLHIWKLMWQGHNVEYVE